MILPNKLNPSMKDWICSHIDVVEDPSFHTCYTKLGKQRYQIVLGKNYRKVIIDPENNDNGYDNQHKLDTSSSKHARSTTEEEQVTLLLHEVSHILRGDCLRNFDKNTNHAQLWCMAADSLINENLNHTCVKGLNGILYHEHIRTDKNIGKYMPAWLPTTQFIFDKMLEHLPTIELSCCGGAKPYEGDRVEAEKIHIKTVLSIRESLTSDEGNLLIKKLGFDLNINNGSLQSLVSGYKPAVWLHTLLSHIQGRSFYGKLEYSRSYARQGRIEELKGNYRIPKKKIMIALDCSGSCSDFLQEFSELANWMKKKDSVQLAAFDVKAWKINTPKNLPNAGGTSFQPVFKLASNLHADAVIMLTDGMATDVKPLPKMPVIWCVTKNHWKPEIRQQDFLMDLSSGKKIYSNA